MGASGTKKAIQPELTPSQIQNLKTRTRMTEEEIQKWFRKSSKSIIFIHYYFVLD